MQEFIDKYWFQLETLPRTLSFTQSSEKLLFTVTIPRNDTPCLAPVQVGTVSLVGIAVAFWTDFVR